jgi:hypothetical protein
MKNAYRILVGKYCDMLERPNSGDREMAITSLQHS